MSEELDVCKHETIKTGEFGLEQPYCTYYLQYLSGSTCDGCPCKEAK